VVAKKGSSVWEITLLQKVAELAPAGRQMRGNAWLWPRLDLFMAGN